MSGFNLLLFHLRYPCSQPENAESHFKLLHWGKYAEKRVISVIWDWLTGWPRVSYWLIVRQHDWLIGWLAYWLTGSLIDWLNDWWTDWLIDWSILVNLFDFQFYFKINVRRYLSSVHSLLLPKCLVWEIIFIKMAFFVILVVDFEQGWREGEIVQY